MLVTSRSERLEPSPELWSVQPVGWAFTALPLEGVRAGYHSPHLGCPRTTQLELLVIVLSWAPDTPTTCSASLLHRKKVQDPGRDLRGWVDP